MEVQIFNNEQFGSIRAAINEHGEPWFVAKDVCSALELQNPTVAVNALDEDERAKFNLGRQGSANVISEAGFYKLVMRSRKPEAKQFQRWVTHEVLPAIRRTGGYMVAKQDETPEETMARAVLIAQDTIKRQKEQLEEMKPKALFADAVAASDGTCLVGELAKLLRQNGVDIGQNRLFAWFRENGFLGNVGQNRNVPTQRAMDMGLFRIKETAITHSDGHVTISRTAKITGKGQQYFVKRFLGRGESIAAR